MSSNSAIAAAPILSIIIVSWEVKQLVLDCIESIYENTRIGADEYEIILVDNASSDNTIEAVAERFPQVKLIANTKNVGFGAANNQAYRASDSEYILLLNPDTVVLDDAVGGLLEYAKSQSNVAVTGCKLLNEDHSLQRWTAGSFPNLANAATHYLHLNRFLPAAMQLGSFYLEHDVQEEFEPDWLCGACLMLRRELIGSEIFDEKFFMYGEDMDLCYRMKQKGFRIVYLPSISIVHFQGKSLEQQEGDILLQSLKGPRNFYVATHGSTFAIVFDLIAVMGFALRALLFSAASLLVGSPRLKSKSRSSVRYLKVGFNVLVNR